MITIIFYILAAITLGSGLLTVLSKNPGHFLMLNAQFLSVIHIIVYTGAIMVLLLFTLMLMNLNEQHEPAKKIARRVAATVSACLMVVVMLAALLKATPQIEVYKNAEVDFQSVKVIGDVILNEYLVPFEFASVLLIASMIGAVLISKRENR